MELYCHLLESGGYIIHIQTIVLSQAVNSDSLEVILYSEL